jgi:hypothetical protein
MDEYLESFSELFPDWDDDGDSDPDLDYEAAVALGNPTTEGFYPEWDGSLPDEDEQASILDDLAERGLV